MLPDAAPLIGDSFQPWQAKPATSQAPITFSMTCEGGTHVQY